MKPALAEIIDPGHPLPKLAAEIDWGILDARFAAAHTPGPGRPSSPVALASLPGQPPWPTRLVALLLILKHLHNLSDEALSARWLENPYHQHFRGEESFQHRLPFERFSLTRWRRRLGADALAALLRESLAVAHKTGALATKDLERVAVDATVQEKNIAFPTGARPPRKAIVKLGEEAKRRGVALRRSYIRVAKRAAPMAGRYAHAKQFKRHNKQLRFLRTRLPRTRFGRLIRDIRRRTRVVGAFPDGESCLNLATARLRHITASNWSTRRYMSMEPLAEMKHTANGAAFA